MQPSPAHPAWESRSARSRAFLTNEARDPKMTTVSARSDPKSWLACVAVIAGVYIYFLIFAQFAFLHLVQGAGSSSLQVRAAMFFMGLAGLVSSLAAGW